MSAALQSPRNVGVSISESPDMRFFGLSNGHLKDAMAGYAIYLLSSGATLAYGGDLRDRGFTRLMFELVLRYQPGQEAVRNYLAWPVHATMNAKEIRELDGALQGFARLILVTPDGHPMPCGEHRTVPPSAVDDKAWRVGLTAMRELMCAQTDARIVLGGRLEGYKGAMPGIAEETLLAIEAKQPVFLVGGFGGCARAIAETLGLADRCARSHDTWQGREQFEGRAEADLNNGLTLEENCDLASTPHVDHAITLVMTGLHRTRPSAGDQLHREPEG